MRFPLQVTPFYRGGKTGRKLPLPARPKIKIAQISTTEHPFLCTTKFPATVWKSIGLFRPQVLVGLARDLHLVSERAKAGEFDLSSVDRAIFVLTRPEDQALTDISRVVLWQAFGVPLYELFIAARGFLVASECDGYEGVHLEPGVSFSDSGEVVFERRKRILPTGFVGEPATDPCPCGRPGVRARSIDGIVSRHTRPVLAAIA
jgi:hypothetical protein